MHRPGLHVHQHDVGGDGRPVTLPAVGKVGKIDPGQGRGLDPGGLAAAGSVHRPHLESIFRAVGEIVDGDARLAGAAGHRRPLAVGPAGDGVAVFVANDPGSAVAWRTPGQGDALVADGCTQFRRSARRRSGGVDEDPQDPVGVGWAPGEGDGVGRGDVQGAVRTHHRRAEPAETPVQLGHDDLVDQRAAGSEAQEAQLRLAQGGDRQPPVPCAPLLALQEDAPTGGQGPVPAGRPLRRDGVGEFAPVGHGRAAFGVERRAVRVHRVEPVVAALDQQVDLVVPVGSVLHRPHLAGARAKRQSLRVAVPVGVDKGLRAAGPEGVVRRPGPGRLVHAQHLAAEGIQVLGDRRHCRVAGGDPQIVLGAEAQPAAAVPASRAYGDAAHQGVLDAGGRRVAGVDGPRDHLYFRRRPTGVPVALAGVEAPVAGEIRVHHDGHQPDLEGIELVGEVPGALQLPNGPVGEADGQREVPFGKQHRAVGREGEVPG